MTAITAKTNKRAYNIEFEGKLPAEGTINGKPYSLDFSKEKENSFHLIYNHRSFNVEVSSFNHENKEVVLSLNNLPFNIKISDHFDALLEKMGMTNLQSNKVSKLNAPMPGMVVEVITKVGDKVSKGDALIVLEAMKMENILKATADGEVKEVLIKKGDAVEKNQILINFK